METQKQSVVLSTSFDYPHVGGVSSHMQLLARQLGVADAEVICNAWLRSRCPSRRHALMFRAERAVRRMAGLQVETVAGKWLVPSFARLSCDIVHCHDAMATWAAAVARKRAGAGYRIVSTVHGPVSRHLQEMGGLDANHAGVRAVEQCEREAWAASDALIAVDTTQSQIIQEQGADPRKITVIPNAVDMESIDEVCASLPLRRGDERPWIILARRLEAKNGVEFAVRALAELARSGPRPRLILAGGGSERPKLVALARELMIESDVVFLGPLGHAALLPLVRTADIVLVPSVPEKGIVEATSIAAIEAMSMGRPVIASAIGGLAELITHGVSGLLVPPRDPAEIARMIREVLASPDLANRLGQGARDAVRERFSAGPWFRRIQEVYVSVR